MDTTPPSESPLIPGHYPAPTSFIKRHWIEVALTVGTLFSLTIAILAQHPVFHHIGISVSTLEEVSMDAAKVGGILIFIKFLINRIRNQEPAASITSDHLKRHINAGFSVRTVVNQIPKTLMRVAAYSVSPSNFLFDEDLNDLTRVERPLDSRSALDTIKKRMEEIDYDFSSGTLLVSISDKCLLRGRAAIYTPPSTFRYIDTAGLTVELKAETGVRFYIGTPAFMEEFTAAAERFQKTGFVGRKENIGTFDQQINQHLNELGLTNQYRLFIARLIP